MRKKDASVCFGLVVGNRGFFPGELVRDGYAVMTELLRKMGYRVIVLGPEDSKYGAVESWQDAKKCADLFRKHQDEIDGVIVTLPNFGDERGVADSLKLAGLDVPVLIHAWADDPAHMDVAHRRDSFCGKMSVCNNLTQYGISYSLTSLHTMDPRVETFKKEIDWFAAVCRVVRGLDGCRVGAVGARPAAFNTVRYSEKILEENGISVTTLDLSEVFGRAGKLGDGDPKVKEKVEAIQGYVSTVGIPPEALAKMAKLAVVIRDWMDEGELDVTALQCWTSMEEYYGVVPCTVMSMMSEDLASSACEVDVGGAIAMHALALASQRPSFLLDWNNNYADDPDKCVCFHCSNLPKSVLDESRMDYQAIIAGTVGKERTYGTVSGRIKAGPMSYLRVSTLDSEGMVGAYLGEGRFTKDELKTFGGYGVAQVPNLQGLLRYICQNGFEHHVAANLSEVASVLYEALDNYLYWDVYWHQG
jgi:L-fucose isomerase-like protein